MEKLHKQGIWPFIRPAKVTLPDRKHEKNSRVVVTILQMWAMQHVDPTATTSTTTLWQCSELLCHDPLNGPGIIINLGEPSFGMNGPA